MNPIGIELVFVEISIAGGRRTKTARYALTNVPTRLLPMAGPFTKRSDAVTARDEVNRILDLGAPKKGPPKQKMYVWRWTSGGYNSCFATSKKEAMEKATKMGDPQGRFHGLIVNVETLHVARKGEIESLDREFRSLCD